MAEEWIAGMTTGNAQMTTSEALLVLEDCDWLKVTQRHVTAVKRHTLDELRMMTREQLARSFYKAYVSIRRTKRESFEGLLVRAAEMVAAGHMPKIRVPALTSEDVCACGSKGDAKGLAWNQQLQRRLCRRCDAAWARAADNNDMRPVTLTGQH